MLKSNTLNLLIIKLLHSCKASNFWNYICIYFYYISAHKIPLKRSVKVVKLQTD